MSLAPSLDASRAKSSSFVAAPLIFALGALALGAFSLAVLNDGDTWSHVATGNWIFDHRAVPRVDPFSLTFAGAPWVAHEWLAEVIFALAYRIAGWAAVMLVTGAAAALAAYTIAEKTIKELPGIGGPVLALAALALVTPGLLARPHVLALPILAIWCARLFDARDRQETPPLALALMMTLWANLHGGFAFGLALIAAACLEAVWEAAPGARLAATRKWALFFVVSVVAALITPFGLQGLLFPIRLIGFSQLANIGEWRAEDFSHPGPLEIFLIGLIAFALLRPMRVTPVRVALIVGLIHLALQHGRHEMLLAVVAPMISRPPGGRGVGGRPAGAAAEMRMDGRRSRCRAGARCGADPAADARNRQLRRAEPRVGGDSRKFARGTRAQQLFLRRLPHFCPCPAVHRRPGGHVWGAFSVTLSASRLGRWRALGGDSANATISPGRYSRRSRGRSRRSITWLAGGGSIATRTRSCTCATLRGLSLWSTRRLKRGAVRPDVGTGGANGRNIPC